MLPEEERSSVQVAGRIQAQAAAGLVRFTEHATEEMGKDDLTRAELLKALSVAEILEHYPDHLRGPCCLVLGTIPGGRDLHIVCSTSLPELVIITVYIPSLPKWVSPRERSK